MRIVVFSLVLCFIALTMGCKARTPSTLERGVMTRAKHWMFVRGKAAKNPIPLTPENLAAGKDAFAHYCIVCHGLDGQNTGVPFADRMLPPVPSLAGTDVQSYTDGQLKWVIDNGLAPAGMPASRGILNDEEIWSIVVYIRHLPPAGSLGEPAAYAGSDATGCEQPTEGRNSQPSPVTPKGGRSK